jgi:hypothetical protein
MQLMENAQPNQMAAVFVQQYRFLSVMLELGSGSTHVDRVEKVIPRLIN